ncbi:hypothetical protein [Vreelandella sp. EE22]
MPNPEQQGGRWRREKGKLEQVSAPAKEQALGAHAEHPSKAKAPKAAPAKANTGAKSTAKVKGSGDDSSTS